MFRIEMAGRRQNVTLHTALGNLAPSVRFDKLNS